MTLRLLFLLTSVSALQAQPLLVEDGLPKAEIIISDKPTRTQRLAAHEFRDVIQKISGAKLPIVTRPTGGAVKVFIGSSEGSPVKAEGLQHGAYRITTGDDWMALIGNDRDYTPLMPFARNNGDIPRAQAEWEKIVGAPYGMPEAGAYKHRLKITLDGEAAEVWGLDERGSFNAVSAYLHKLGARWYMPGEIGEVLPSLRKIELPKLDETVKPDFALRQFNVRFGTAGADLSRWIMRLGTRNDEKLQIAHGLASMTTPEGVFAAHPEWYALYGGKRDYQSGYSKNQLCYSNDEFFRETVRYARVMLDTYKFDSVSIMPPDGYTSICQCDKCKGKDSPDRHERGLLSNHVWDFVNRVAKELGKTHPKAKVLNCAYGAYTLPPDNIDKLERNVAVCIVGGRRPLNKAGAKGEGEAAPEALREKWLKKTSNPLLNFENYPFTGRGWYLPSFVPHALGDSVNATKGISDGEDIWLSANDGFEAGSLAFNHFQTYFTARMYWGGKEADVDAMFREYCRLFYGPAEQEMLTFFTFCEVNWSTMEDDKARADEALALFEKAKSKAKAGSVYANRLALMDAYLKGLRMKSEQLGKKRGPVPVVRLVGEAKEIVVDGKLDDAFWQTCNGSATGRFRELQTGREPVFGTTFKSGWFGDSVIFAIRCNERRGDKPRSTATREDDPGLWKGDAVEIQIATETHSYYQIAISPDGYVTDLDRGAPKGQWFGWDSKAEVATQIADDHWSIEIRLPVTQDENDPLHQIIGREPKQSLPWHINLCRQRMREDGSEFSALSPTGTEGFHEPDKFAYFYSGRSHVFDADPNVTDFVIAFREAAKQRKPAAYLALADGKVTELQKAVALEQAAALDRKNAEAHIERISLEPVKQTALMQHLLGRGQAAVVIERFANEDFSKWPFWKRGDAYRLRGLAYVALKDARNARTDLAESLEWTSDARVRGQIEQSLATLK